MAVRITPKGMRMAMGVCIAIPVITFLARLSRAEDPTWPTPGPGDPKPVHVAPPIVPEAQAAKN